ncbi:MAG TPA: DUF5684 domain-containing protein [Gemmatimonadales bacterium]|nr:DUF5684 domain-containing protein [Gemmatimonadales bacterium]
MQDTFDAPSTGLSPTAWIVVCAVMVFYIASMWKIYTKAGQPGWAAIIPIYNLVVLHQIVGKPIWWIILYFIPIVGIVIGIIVTHALSVSFGKGVGFTLGLIFLGFIFYPVLAWSDAQYLGPTAGTPVPV